jgi:predicted Zn-dependent protease
MRGPSDFHFPALARHAGRWAVFARTGTTFERRYRQGRGWEGLEATEAGVACRVAGGGTVGFSAAAGSAAVAGREAARAALASRRPGEDPLPPRNLLGRTAVPALPPSPDSDSVESFSRRLLAALAGAAQGTRIGELRVMAGMARAAILTAEGHVAPAAASGAVIEIVTFEAGFARVFHTAARSLAGLDPDAIADRAHAVLSLASRGGSPARHLCDVLLAPAVAARLITALAPLFVARARSAALPRSASLSWHLTDARPGPDGLLPLPWDGEGIVSRVIPLVAEGRVHRDLATWRDATVCGTPPGGAVRPSYRSEPTAGAANLVVRPDPSGRPGTLLEALGDGAYAALPLGEVVFDPGDGRFSVACTGLSVRAGRRFGDHAALEVRGSARSFLRGLRGVGGDSESFSLACAVTTPSLLVRGLHVA